MPTLTANGLTLCYDTQGDPRDEAIVLIMGLGMQLIAWPEPFCRQLVEMGFYVIRFDNRDAGLSGKLDRLGTPNLLAAYVKSLLRMPLSAGYKLPDMAADTVGLLDALGLEKAHIVGASMGGMIAQIVAAAQPQRVVTLTSIMSSSGRRGLPGPSAAARRVLLSRPSDPRDLESVVSHMVKVFRTIGSPAYPAPEAVLHERLKASVQRNVSAAGTARQMLAIAASGDRIALLKSIRRPTLVIHGTDDPLVPLACGRDTAQLVPGATLREIRGMGHDLPAELLPVMARMIGAHCRGQAIPAA